MSDFLGILPVLKKTQAVCQLQSKVAEFYHPFQFEVGLHVISMCESLNYWGAEIDKLFLYKFLDFFSDSKDNLISILPP